MNKEDENELSAKKRQGMRGMNRDQNEKGNVGGENQKIEVEEKGGDE